MRLLEVIRALSADRRDLRLSGFSERRVAWAVASGLGPAMRRAVELDPDAKSQPAWQHLEAADSTARVLASYQSAAVVSLIDACHSQGIPLTLIKGIAVCDAYPAPHLRPMRDIDVLVAASLVPATLAVCRDLGYDDDPDAAPGAYDRHHHAVPLVHRATGIWLEIHHRLFPVAAASPGRDPFTPEGVAAQTLPATYYGREVGRLSRELELPYLASHWARSGKPIVGPGGVIGLLDVIMLGSRLGRSDWSRVGALVEGTPAARHLRLVLEYLTDRRLLSGERPVLHERDFAPRTWVKRWIAHAIIDRHIIEGTRPGGRAWLRGVEAIWPRVQPPSTSEAV